MELDIWSGIWGLPSAEFKSLQALTLLKISGAVFKTNRTNNPYGTTNGLPVFHHDKKQLHSYCHILAHLEQKNYLPDLNLSVKERGESFAYKNLVEEKLSPALRYVWWVNDKNYKNVTRPWFAKMLPFPLNFYYPARYHRDGETAIQSLYPHLEDMEIEVEVFKEAEKCLTCLSNRLGNSDFFYGNHPSSLDAFVYGYLAPLLKAPFPANTLQNHLKASINLVEFINRITLRYFVRELEDYVKECDDRVKNASKSDLFHHKLRNQILAAAFAVTAMLTYAVSSGIFSFSLRNSGLDDVVGFNDDESDYFE